MKKYLPFFIMLTSFITASVDLPTFTEVNESTQQSRFFIGAANIDGVPLETTDYILAKFNGKYVGRAQWNGTYADLIVMGDDGTETTAGYLSEGDTFEFRFFKSETGYIYPATHDEEFTFQPDSATPVRELTAREQDRLWSLFGYKHWDMNCNYMYELGIEPLLPGWEVQVLYPPDPYMGEVIGSGITDASGHWFVELPDQYDMGWLQEVPQAGWQQNYPAEGGYFVWYGYPYELGFSNALIEDCPLPQACCFPDGSCADMSVGNCAGQGGTTQGEGTDCATSQCPVLQPVACCFTYGCEDFYASDCVEYGGQPQAQGTDCATTECNYTPTPHGEKWGDANGDSEMSLGDIAQPGVAIHFSSLDRTLLAIEYTDENGYYALPNFIIDPTTCTASLPDLNPPDDIYDLCYIEVISMDSYCCNVTWDGICNGEYNTCLAGRDDSPEMEQQRLARNAEQGYDPQTDRNGDYVEDILVTEADFTPLIPANGFYHWNFQTGDQSLDFLNSLGGGPDIPQTTQHWQTVPGDPHAGTGSRWWVSTPAGFFEPGSDPFEEHVYVQDTPVGLGNTSFDINQGPVTFGEGGSDTVPIEMVALDLHSTQPIVVNTPGGPSFWDVKLELSDLVSSSGENTILDGGGGGGGTFNSVLEVHPRLTFTNIDDPTDIRFLDDLPTVLESLNDAPWSPTGPPEVIPGTFLPGVLNASELLPIDLENPETGSRLQGMAAEYVTACCLPAGVCEDISARACEAKGGEPLLGQFNCEMNPCGGQPNYEYNLFDEVITGDGWNGEFIPYESGWVNMWWPNEFTPASRKEITLSFWLDYIPSLPVPEVAFNWVIPQWNNDQELGAPPFIDAPIIRRLTDVTPGFNSYTITIPFCPSWVSLDVRSLFPFKIKGTIDHTCLQPGFPELDPFPETRGVLTLLNPDGTEDRVPLSGSSGFEMYFDGPNEGDSIDDNVNGRDESMLFIPDLTLQGDLPIFRNPILLLMDGDDPAYGTGEEIINLVPGRMDVLPFADIPQNLEINAHLFPVLQIDNVPYKTNEGIVFQGITSFKPFGPGDALRGVGSLPVPTFGPLGESGPSIIPDQTIIVPDPFMGACCLGEICTRTDALICMDLDGEFLGMGTTCSPINPCGPPPDFYFEKDGQTIEGGGNGWNGEWIEYESGWINMWWPNEFALNREKEINLLFDLDYPVGGPVPEIAFNWVVPLWSGPQFEDLPPMIDGPIRRFSIPDLQPGPNQLHTLTLPFCPAWVSVDVRSEGDFSIAGTIEHTCLGPGTTEIDVFPGAAGTLGLITVDGPMVLPLLGTGEVHVYFPSGIEGVVDDNTFNGLDEAMLELPQLDMVSQTLQGGAVVLGVDPVLPSPGLIEEQLNLNPGMMDLPPFIVDPPDLRANVNLSARLQVGIRGLQLHPQIPVPFFGEVGFKPAGPGDILTGVGVEPIPLLDENGMPTGDYIIPEQTRIIFDPIVEACCLDGECSMLPDFICSALGGESQGTNSQCEPDNPCISEPIAGCMDPAAINYNPLATIEGEFCVFADIDVRQVDVNWPGIQLVNSGVGLMSTTYFPWPMDMFLNTFTVDQGGEIYWIGQNILLPDIQTTPGEQNISFRFDLAPMGIQPGMPLTEFPLWVSADPQPLQGFPPVLPPVEIWPVLQVGDFINDTGGGYTILDPWPGIYEEWPPQINPEFIISIYNHKVLRGCIVPNIDLDDANHGDNAATGYAGDLNACGPAGASNSLEWLEIVHPGLLNNNQTHRQVLEDISGEMDRAPNSGVDPEQFITGKLKYSKKHNLPIHTKYQSWELAGQPDIVLPDGVTSADNQTPAAGKPTWDWLVQEMEAGEDVEIFMGWFDASGNFKGGHVVTCTGIIEYISGHKVLKYKDDGRQEVADASEVIQSDSPITIGDDGFMHITNESGNGMTAKITNVISESLDEDVIYPESGACCLEGYYCEILEGWECFEFGGEWLGPDSECTPNPCIPQSEFIFNGFTGEQSGTGWEGTWFEYPDGWLNMWWPNDYDLQGSKIITIEYYVEFLPGLPMPEFAINWSHPQWDNTETPPMAQDDLAGMVVRAIAPNVVQGPNIFQVELDFCPAWVSMDIRGVENVFTFGDIHHDCIPAETGACCLPSSICVGNMSEDECENDSNNGVWQGANTVCEEIECIPWFIEVDVFPETFGEFEIIDPTGMPQPLTGTGPTVVHVFFEGPGEGDAEDDDDDGLDEVETEMVSLDLTGLSPTFGPVTVRLNPDLPSQGKITEQNNLMNGRLDLPPFAPDGTADSFFDIFFEVEVGGQVLHTEAAKHMTSLIDHKPPGPGTLYFNPDIIPLLTVEGFLSGFSIGNTSHIPDPRAACCFGEECNEIFPWDCVLEGGVPQPFGTFCDDIPYPCQPETGACCLPDYTCAVMTEEVCINAVNNGSWQGPDSTCQPNTCGNFWWDGTNGGGTGFNNGEWQEYPDNWVNQWWPNEYNPNGAKLIRIEYNLAELPVFSAPNIAINWSHINWDNEDQPPDWQADLNGMILRAIDENAHQGMNIFEIPVDYCPAWVSMDIQYPQGVVVNGGIFHECISEPVGACCLPDYTCAVMTEGDCVSTTNNGSWQGPNSTCEPNTCGNFWWDGLNGGGTGFNNGEWQEYPDNWVNQWWPNEYDPTGSKIIRIEYNLVGLPVGSLANIAINWSHINWDNEDQPPNWQADENGMILRAIDENAHQGFNIFEIPVDYCPAWVSMDIQYPQGVVVNGRITHECVPSTCGDGNLDPGEQCDDNNLVNGDGCNQFCQTEFCGDGILNDAPNEDCDDGNLDNTDACIIDPLFGVMCVDAACGDGYLWAGHEQCDDGNLANGDGCDNSCVLEICGDGVINNLPNEQCDDNNNLPGDGCDPNCILEICGNGVVQPGSGEQCDDGNLINLDGCNANCITEYCGDGILNNLPWEECDDGNSSNDDGCTVNCTIVPTECRIDGYKWLDLIGDGIWQQDLEPPLEGWNIQLFDDSGLLIGNDLTDTNGYYCIENNPCTSPDDGTGTAELPPDCPLVNPNNVYRILDGLPAGSSVEIEMVIDSFFDVFTTQGGMLDGEIISFNAIGHLIMIGTGELGGFSRQMVMEVALEVHIGPRVPGDPIQVFPQDLYRLEGAIFGDPDFNFMHLTAGTQFGLPSPGHTTLTQLSDGTFNVDSFFDITYTIDFSGANGGNLQGLSGSTTGTLRAEFGGENILGDLDTGDALTLAEVQQPGYTQTYPLPPGTHQFYWDPNTGYDDFLFGNKETVTGACCWPGGYCSVVEEDICESDAGIYQGDDVPCDPDPCEPQEGACCFDDGTCVFTTEQLCLGNAGTYMGNGVTCEEAGCPEPTGACCFMGQCGISTRASCLQFGGTYMGDGVPCDPDPCVIPLGACCWPDGSCAYIEQELCASDAGIYQGDGVSCDEAACPQPYCGDGYVTPPEQCEVHEDCNPGFFCVDCMCMGSFIEHDVYESSVVSLELMLPAGNETIIVTGPSQWYVYFEQAEGQAMDNDQNGRDEVAAELIAMDFSGMSSYGPVMMTQHPFYPILGIIEEQANQVPGILEVMPFAPGSADSFFDVFFEIQIGNQLLYLNSPTRMAGVLTHKPAGNCDDLVIEEPVELYDEAGNPTGIYIIRLVYVPDGTSACCLPDGNCVDSYYEDCLNMAGNFQPGDCCEDIECVAQIGACCFEDGTCLMAPDNLCESLQGVYQGDGVTCVEANCQAVRGACCWPDGYCAYIEQEVCESENGIYQGDGVTCDEADCQPYECGNGILEGPEECDDGNLLPEDGCDGNCEYEGDASFDGALNVTDIVIIVGNILNGQYNPAGDVNYDGFTNVIDIVLIVEWILYGNFGRGLPIRDAEMINDNGVIRLNADGNVAGIQMEISGKARIIRTMIPDGWQLHQSDRVILLISMDGSALTDDVLFSYEGDLVVESTLIADWYGGSVVSEIVAIPDGYKLHEAYPNPFNPVTSISYSLPEAAMVGITIFDMLGKEVTRLIDGQQTGGTYTVTWDASGEPSGVYFVVMEANGFKATQKIMLIR